MSISSALNLLANSSSFMSIPLIFLLSQKEVISYFDSNQIECRKLDSHPCLIKNLFGLRNESTFRFSIKSLEELFTSYIHSILDAQETQGYFGPIDIIEFILVNMHCYAVNQKCYESEEIKLSVCNSPCLLHQYFNLMVSETQTCKCGLSWNNDWEINTICQYFHITSIFSDFDASKSSNLLIMPKICLKSINPQNPQFNSSSFKSKIIRSLTSKMGSASSDYCESPSCQYSSSSVSFNLNQYPTWYLIDLIYEDHNKTYLESYLSTISIDHTIELKSIYKQGLNQRYQLEGVFFYNPKSKLKLKLAQLKGKFWSFNRLQGEASWDKVVNEALLMNFHPVALVYKARNNLEKVEIEDFKLVKMEQIAVQSDAFKKKFGRDVVDEEEKVPESRRVEGLDDDFRIGIYSGRSSEKVGLRVWRCECGKEISSDFDVCAFCQKVRPGVTGWVCDKCTFKNDDYTNLCLGCHEFRSRGFDRLEDERNKFSWPRKIGNYVDKEEEVKEVKPASQLNVDWVCQCSEINQSDYEVCLKCNSLKPGLSGWVCKVCKVRNEDGNFRCSACDSWKGVETSDQDFWLCENCKSANTFKSRYCGQCYKLSGDYGYEKDKFCGKCRQRFDKILDECPNCKILPVNDALKLLKKCGKCKIKDIYLAGRCIDCQFSSQFEDPKPAESTDSIISNQWECASCKTKNYDWSLNCKYCQKSKNIKSENNWTCSICSRENLIKEAKCWYCRSEQIYPPSRPASKKACIECGNSIEYVKCYKCQKLENFEIGYCGRCNSDLKSVSECYRCYDKKYKEDFKTPPADSAKRNNYQPYEYISSVITPPNSAYSESRLTSQNPLRRSQFNNKY